MSQRVCYKPGCGAKAKFKCVCTTPETYMCEKHIDDRDPLFRSHMGHELINVYCKPDYASKDAFLKFLNTEIMKLGTVEKIIVENTMLEIKAIENSLHKILFGISDAKNTLSRLLEEINSLREMPYDSSKSLYNWLKLPIQEVNALIENLKRTKELPSSEGFYQEMIDFTLDFALKPIESPLEILEILNEGNRKSQNQCFKQQMNVILNLKNIVGHYKNNLNQDLRSPINNERSPNSLSTYKQDFEALAKQDISNYNIPKRNSHIFTNNNLAAPDAAYHMTVEGVELEHSDSDQPTTEEASSVNTTHSAYTAETISDYSPMNTQFS
ncbi:unnamed protein product [Blepharisma stoltei]|uniref:Uncharacterized protein n=1 Tax=Blepharisma stoltei TaxID=1481888 RepID=A0AAU9IM51_9CILI|nr:unnamed protein product [Blepharisma stoltei]